VSLALTLSAASGGEAGELSASTPRMSWWTGTAAKVALAGSVIALLGAGGQLWRNSLAPRRTPATVAAQSSPESRPSAAPSSPEPVSVTKPASDASTSMTDLPHARQARFARPRISPPPKNDSSLSAETTLLADVSRALDDHDLVRGGRLLKQYRAHHPHGQLRVEAQGLELLGRCLAAESGARVRARAYLRKSPEAMLAARIATACTATSSP
jgi:hypothetical protein